MPVAALNISPNICGAVPWPKPQSNLPGLALACSISCPTEFAGSPGLTTRTQAMRATLATGMKSLAGSRPTTLAANASPIAPHSNVWPSGAALVNSPTPIVPPPPGRFSTMTGFPRRFDKSFVTSRAEGDIDVEELYDEPLVVVAGVDNPWLRRRKIRLAE